MKKSLEVILGVLLLSCFAVNGVNAHVQGSMRALRLEGGLEVEEMEERRRMQVEQISPDIEMEQVFSALGQIKGAEEVMRIFREEGGALVPGPLPPKGEEEPPGRWRPEPKPVPPGPFPITRIALLTPNNPTNPRPWNAYLDLWGIDAFAGYSNLSRQYRMNRVAYLNPRWNYNTPRGAGRINGWFFIRKRGWYLFAAKVCGEDYGINFDVSVDNDFYGSFEVTGVDVICVFVWLPGGYWHRVQLDHTGGWGWFISLKAWRTRPFNGYEIWEENEWEKKEEWEWEKE